MLQLQDLKIFTKLGLKMNIRNCFLMVLGAAAAQVFFLFVFYSMCIQEVLIRQKTVENFNTLWGVLFDVGKTINNKDELNDLRAEVATLDFRQNELSNYLNVKRLALRNKEINEIRHAFSTRSEDVSKNMKQVLERLYIMKHTISNDDYDKLIQQLDLLLGDMKGTYKSLVSLQMPLLELRNALKELKRDFDDDSLRAHNDAWEMKKRSEERNSLGWTAGLGSLAAAGVASFFAAPFFIPLGLAGAGGLIAQHSFVESQKYEQMSRSIEDTSKVIKQFSGATQDYIQAQERHYQHFIELEEEVSNLNGDIQSIGGILKFPWTEEKFNFTPEQKAHFEHLINEIIKIAERKHEDIENFLRDTKKISKLHFG